MSIFTPKISLKVAEQLCARFSTAIRSGIDPLKLLDMESKIGTKRHQAAAADVRQRLLGGDTLSEAMSHRSDYFPWLMTNLVDAGEQAGGIDKSFAYLSQYYRDLRNTRSSFLKQISWPVIQILLAIMIISLFIWLMGVLFNDPSQDNYDPLGFGLKGVSGVLTLWFYIAVVSIAIGIVVRAIWKNWFGLHSLLMPLAINVPVIGAVFKYLALSRLTMVLSLLLNAGVDAIRAVQMAFTSTGNNYYIRQAPQSIAAVKKGQTLSESFAASRVLPREFIEAVEVGELSGNETESLDALARQYDSQAKNALLTMSVTASVLIWIMIAGLIIFLIFRFFLNYVNMIQDLSNGKF